MVVSELRIGNYVINCINNKLDTIKTISKYQINNFDIESTICTHKPIPITKEWLIKFGFEKEDFSWYISDYIWKLELENEDNYTLIMCSFNVVRNIKYVHQLQNLYFALTGEELKYNG